MEYLLAVAPVAMILQALLRRGIRGIDHLLLFNLGFLLYVSVPLFLTFAPIFADGPLFEFWGNIAALLTPDARDDLAAFAALVWGSFHLGHALGRGGTGDVDAAAGRTLATRSPLGDRYHRLLTRALTVALPFLSLAVIGFVGLLAVLNRDQFGAVYDIDQDVGVRGPVQLAVALCAMFLLIGLSMGLRLRGGPLLFPVAALVFCILVSALLGSRQGPVLALIALAVYGAGTSVWLKIRHLVLMGIVVVPVIAMIGVLRLGIADPIYAVIAVGIETHGSFISTITFFAFNDLPDFRMPEALALAMVNLVPSALWQEKAAVINAYATPFSFASPLGAQHFFVSLIDNFGLIGSGIAMILFGWMFARLRRAARSVLVAPMYVFAAAVLATEIWRNPFSVSIVKALLQSAFIFPVVIYAVAAVIIILALNGRSADRAAGARRLPELG